MEKITKYYVKTFVYGRDWVVKEVDSLDPEMIDVKDITQFAFYEQSFIVDGEDIYTGVQKKVSPTYHVGVRMSIDYAIIKAPASMKQFYESMKNERGFTSVCHSDFGYVELMDNDSITLQEYREQKKKNKH